MITKLKKLPKELKNILDVISSLAEPQGVRVYLVGGIVRDLLLGRTNLDLDIVVEGDAAALAQALAQRYSAKFTRHHAFGTATVFFDNHKIDFATARKEYYSRPGVLPAVEPSDLRDDLFRRDFTINAMAISLNKNDYAKLIDFYSGSRDLKQKLIRVLHNRSFSDDPTRILRAVRFEQRFSFKIEKKTLGLIKEAAAQEALRCVHAHRLRDELVLILKEPKPCRNVKRIGALTGFLFINKSLKVNKRIYGLLCRVEKTIGVYGKKFGGLRKVDAWLIYLIGLMIGLKREEIAKFVQEFDFRKGDRIRVLSAKDSLAGISCLDKNVKPRDLYRKLFPLSLETILFFYAYYSGKTIRRQIELFLGKLIHIRLKVKGSDLKALGFQPLVLYGKVLEGLLDAKIEKKLATKGEELKEAKDIFHKLLLKQPV